MITCTQTNGNGPISDSGWSSGGKELTMANKVDDFRGDLVPFSKIFFSCSRFFYDFQFFGIWRFPFFGYGSEGMQWRVTGFDTSQFLFPSTCTPKMFAKTVTKFSVYVDLLHNTQ